MKCISFKPIVENIKNSDDFSIWFTLLVTLVPALIFFMALIGAIVIQNLPSDEGSDTEDDAPKIGMYSYEETRII